MTVKIDKQHLTLCRGAFYQEIRHRLPWDLGVVALKRLVNKRWKTHSQISKPSTYWSHSPRIFCKCQRQKGLRPLHSRHLPSNVIDEPSSGLEQHALPRLCRQSFLYLGCLSQENRRCQRYSREGSKGWKIRPWWPT